MTKQQEIDALVKFTNSIPKDSYLWPWLIDVQASVIADIRNDVVVAPSIKATREHCDLLVLKAEGEANRIIADAEAKADKITKAAHAEASSTRNQITSLLERCRNAICSI